MRKYLWGTVLAGAAGMMAGAKMPPALEPLALVQSVSGQGDGGLGRADLPAPATRPNEWVVTAAKAELSGPTLAMGAEEELSGNGATYYMGAVADLRNFRQREFDAEKLYALLDAGLEALKRKDVRVLGLSQTESTVQWLREAVRRPQVEWPNDVGPEGAAGADGGYVGDAEFAGAAVRGCAVGIARGAGGGGAGAAALGVCVDGVDG